MRLALRNRDKIIKELGTDFCARLILAVADYEKNNEDVSINGRIRFLVRHCLRQKMTEKSF